LVAAAIDALEAGPKAYVILGNHDRQTQDDRDHACAPMVFTSVEVVSKNCAFRYGDLIVACAPYQPGVASEWLPHAMFEAKSQGSSGRVILLTHLGIWDEDTAPYLKGARDAVGIGQVRWLCDAHKVDAFVAGNWHHYRSWDGDAINKSHVLIPGTLCPHSFSDEARPSDGLKSVGSLVIYNSETNGTITYSMPGPRFMTVDLVGVASTQAGPRGSDWMTYYRLRVKRDELTAAILLRDSVEANFNALVELEVVDDQAVIQRAAAEAIKASGGDLVEAYADLADVQEPGTKEGVQRRLIEYRKGAG